MKKQKFTIQDVVKRPLSSRAVDYVNASLRNGKTLSRAILAMHDLGKGEVYALLPPEVQADKLEDFKSSVFMSLPGKRFKNADTCLVLNRLIKDFLSDDDNNICIFEEHSFDADSPCVRSSDIMFFTFKKEVYYFLKVGSDNSLVNRTVRKSYNHWLFTVVMTSFFSEHGVLNNRGNLNIKKLFDLGRCATMIIAGAYDGDGYIVWSKK